MASFGESFTVREYADRAKKLFTSPERHEILHDNAPRKKGLIVTFCVLASCLLWFTFSMRETYTQFFDFPTEIQNLPDNQALIELPPNTVRVQVEGEGIQLLRLYYNPPTVPINAAEDGIDLQVLTAEAAGNVRQESVTPGFISIRKEERIERRVPIRSMLRIDTESGYEVVGPVWLSPDSVTLSGAISVVEKMSFWPTTRQNIEAVRDTVRQRISLSDTLSGLVLLDISEVGLQADIVRFTSGSREIALRVKDGPGQGSFTFEPSRTMATYNVPLFQYDLALEAEDFYAFVTYEELVGDTTGNVYPIVNVPEGLLLREIHIFPNAFRYYRNLPGSD